MPDRSSLSTEVPDDHADVVLIVDDLPDNLRLLHDALDDAGHTVLVATDGPSAIQRAIQARPDIVLLDALMPGMDGFEVARRLKAEAATAAIPIVFMTALTDTEHVVAAFDAGGIDYVTKPIQPREVLARIAAHTRSARSQRRARLALDAFGHATLVVRGHDGRLVWQTALARRLLKRHFGSEGEVAPVLVVDWLRRESAALAQGVPAQALSVARGGCRLTLHLHPMAEAPADDGGASPSGAGAAGIEEWLVVATESDDAAQIQAMVQAFGLTPREAEVLHWVVQGKTNRDVAEILGSAARTVTKHMEHILQKLGVETRTAATAMVMARLRGLRRMGGEGQA
jgi:DNA-binding response OmpR family regulator/DNA-binding CsgD family transcriptional regulator